jgi:hypothetical protein
VILTRLISQIIPVCAVIQDGLAGLFVPDILPQSTTGTPLAEKNNKLHVNK